MWFYFTANMQWCHPFETVMVSFISERRRKDYEEYKDNDDEREEDLYRNMFN